MKGEFHGKPVTVWSLGILLFTMLCGYFPDSFDFYRTNMNTWYKPGLTEGVRSAIFPGDLFPFDGKIHQKKTRAQDEMKETSRRSTDGVRLQKCLISCVSGGLNRLVSPSSALASCILA